MRALLSAVATVCCVAAALPARAQEAVKTVADPRTKTISEQQKEALTVKPNVVSRKLDNGLELLIIEDHSLPLVTIEVAVKNGAFTESPEFNGLSHLYEHMFFKANQAIPTQEQYLARTRELGLVWNGTTSEERVNYFFTMGSAQLEDGMKFMADATLTPLFEEGELVKEREVVIGEVDRNESNPYFHLFRAMDQHLFSKYPTRKDTLGDRVTIQTATREKMLTMKQKYYVPNNSALVIAGDVTPDAAETVARQWFGAWPTSPDPFKTDPIPKHPALKKTEAFVVTQPVQTATIQLGWHGPSVSEDPASTYAADVFHFILGQRSSAFQKALVDSGLALQVGGGYYTLNHTGPISYTMVTTPDKIDAAITALQAEIARFASPDYFTDEQLETAKTLLTIDHLYSQEKTSSFAHTVSFWWAVAGLDYLNTYLPKLQAVSRADIQRFVTTYLDNKNYVLGLLVSEDTQKLAGLDDKKLKTWAKPIRVAKGKVKGIKKGGR